MIERTIPCDGDDCQPETESIRTDIMGNEITYWETDSDGTLEVESVSEDMMMENRFRQFSNGTLVEEYYYFKDPEERHDYDYYRTTTNSDGSMNFYSESEWGVEE
jgi:hypothetical protein